MSDDIARARANFRQQEKVYLSMVERQKALKDTIESATKRLALLEKQLPQQKAWYEASKAKIAAFGDQETSTRLSKMAQLKAEIERLGGEPISVPALDEAKQKAQDAVRGAHEALNAAGVSIEG